MRVHSSEYQGPSKCSALVDRGDGGKKRKMRRGRGTAEEWRETGQLQEQGSQEPCVLGTGLYYTGGAQKPGSQQVKGRSCGDKATGCSRKGVQKIKNPKSNPYLFYALCG